MSNIVVRTLTGAVFITVVLFPLFWNKEVAAGVLGFFMLLALIEFYQMLAKYKNTGFSWEYSTIYGTIIFGIGTGILFNYLPSVLALAILPLTIFLCVVELWRNKSDSLFNASSAVFGVIYIVLPFLTMVHLHLIDENPFPLLAGMFILIWMNDTFAYLSGRFFGKHKLIERISPNKTWEGTIGGIVFTVLAGAAIGIVFDPDHILYWTLSSLIVAPGAIFGDLFESLIKRNVGVKDSGNILPGHGGILDRFDATLFAAPFFVVWTYLWTYFYICI